MKILPGAVVARRLQARGFGDLTAEEACRIGPWMCFTPMLQALLFAGGTATGAVTVFCALGALLLVASLTGRHPFDWIYDGVIRLLERSPELPPSPPRRRAVFLLGAVWCLGTAAAFGSGLMLLGYLLGAAMTVSTSLLAFTHICIPSRAFEWISRRLRPRRLTARDRPPPKAADAGSSPSSSAP